MEDRTNIRLRSGIANARKCSMAKVDDSDTQTVTVEDGFAEVRLCLQSSSYPAGLTPEQAEVLAQQLIDAAKRVRDAIVQ
jgi:hypothetical protein